MLSILSDEFSDTSSEVITLHLSRNDQQTESLLPNEKSQISSYILRKYPDQGFSKVRLQFDTSSSTVIPIVIPQTLNEAQLLVSNQTVEDWLQASIGWDSHSQTLTFFRKGQIAQVTVDQAYIRIEGARTPLDRPIRQLAHAIRLPIGSISEVFGIPPEQRTFPHTVWMQLDKDDSTFQ